MLLMAYAAAITVWANQEASTHVCTGIDIHIDASRGSADSLASHSLRTEIDRFPDKIVGAPLNTVNTLKIERFLSQYNNLESVKCVLTSEGRLRVDVVPMIPEVRIFPTSGPSYYINKDGKRMNADARFFVNVPVVQGDFTEKFPASYVLPVVRYIQNDPELTALVASLQARGPEDIYLVPRIGGHVINWGDTSRLADKRSALLTLYRTVLPRKGWAAYDTLSVKYRNQLVCTRRIKPIVEKEITDSDETDLEEATLEGIEVHDI